VALLELVKLCWLKQLLERLEFLLSQLVAQILLKCLLELEHQGSEISSKKPEKIHLQLSSLMKLMQLERKDMGNSAAEMMKETILSINFLLRWMGLALTLQ